MKGTQPFREKRSSETVFTSQLKNDETWRLLCVDPAQVLATGIA
jgi:hypothetical protein